MKTSTISTMSGLCFIWLLNILLSAAPAAGAENSTQRKIYDGSANGRKQVSDALIIAKRDQKHILLQFGANWCGWCLKLHRLFESDKAIREGLSTNYVSVLIDVDQNHNRFLAAQYGLGDNGIPFLVVLDAGGRILTTQNTGELEEGDHYSRQKVIAFLKKWGVEADAGNSGQMKKRPRMPAGSS